MKTSKCPKCDSAEIFTRKPSKVGGGATKIFLSSFKVSFPEVRVCTKCGFLEHYIADESDLETIKKKWSKL
jgi:predicted nucleic-acid-binding Zn-ribbon protein